MDLFAQLEGKLPFYKEDGFSSSSSSANTFPFLEAMLIFTTLVFILEYYLDTRQYRNFINIKDVPQPLKGHISDEYFTKSQLYNSDKAEFALAEGLFQFWIGIIGVILGQLPYVWDQSKMIALKLNLYDNNSSDIMKEMMISSTFIILGTLYDASISIPMSLYKTFVIEERHGFNKCTLITFILDRIKMFLLLLFIGSPIICSLIYVVRLGGENFFIYASIFIFSIQMILMTIYPTLIAPLFNKYEKLEDGPTYEAVAKLAKQVKFPLTALYKVDGSTRSAHSNAYFYGFFNNKRIVLYDTLIDQVVLPELLAILGHEIGHWKLGHTIQGLIITQLYMFLYFLSFSYVTSNKELLQDFGFCYTSSSTTPVLIGLSLFSSTFWAPVDKILSLIMSSLSRYNEFGADAFARDLGMGDDLAEGLIKISKENLGNLVPDPYYASYHFSHPPVVDRLRKVRKKFTINGEISKSKDE